MLRGVGQALLHDPVGGQPDGGRHRTDVAVQVQAHVDAGGAELLDQADEVAYRPATASSRSVGPSHQADRVAHLVETLAAEPLGLGQRPRRLIRVVGEREPGAMTRAAATR